MKISKKEEDFRIYVENDKGQFIRTDDILASENSLSKRIYFRINLRPDLFDGFEWSINLTREEIKDLAELTNEVCKYL